MMNVNANSLASPSVKVSKTAQPFIDVGEAERRHLQMDAYLQSGQVTEAEAAKWHYLISRYTLIAPGYNHLEHVLDIDSVIITDRKYRLRPEQAVEIMLPALTRRDGKAAGKRVYVRLRDKAKKCCTQFVSVDEIFLTLQRRDHCYLLQIHHRRYILIRNLCAMPRKNIDRFISQVIKMGGHFQSDASQDARTD